MSPTHVHFFQSSGTKIHQLCHNPALLQFSHCEAVWRTTAWHRFINRSSSLMYSFSWARKTSRVGPFSALTAISSFSTSSFNPAAIWLPAHFYHGLGELRTNYAGTALMRAQGVWEWNCTCKSFTRRGSFARVQSQRAAPCPLSGPTLCPTWETWSLLTCN